MGTHSENPLKDNFLVALTGSQKTVRHTPNFIYIFLNFFFSITDFDWNLKISSFDDF